MSDDQEPSDEDMAELLGEEHVPGVVLPQGRQANMQPETNSGTAPPPEAFGRNKPKTAGEGKPGSLVIEGLRGQRLDPLVIQETSSTSEAQLGAPASLDEPPTLETAILALPALWMRVYVEALYLAGDPVKARAAVKAKIGTVLPSTVSRFQRECPAFGQLCADHEQIQHQTLDAYVYRGGTEGDLTPFNTKEGIEWYRRRSDKAAETYYKRHGLMAADQVQHTHTGRVELAQDSALPGMLADVARLLFPPAKQIEGKVVSESDTKEP